MKKPIKAKRVPSKSGEPKRVYRASPYAGDVISNYSAEKRAAVVAEYIRIVKKYAVTRDQAAEILGVVSRTTYVYIDPEKSKMTVNALREFAQHFGEDESEIEKISSMK